MTIDVSLLNVVLQKASLLLDRLQTDHLALKEQEPTPNQVPYLLS